MHQDIICSNCSTKQGRDMLVTWRCAALAWPRIGWRGDFSSQKGRGNRGHNPACWWVYTIWYVLVYTWYNVGKGGCTDTIIPETCKSSTYALRCISIVTALVDAQNRFSATGS